MKCAGCGAEVESEHVAHYPPKDDGIEQPETPETPTETPDETPPENKPNGESGWNWATTMFDEGD